MRIEPIKFKLYNGGDRIEEILTFSRQPDDRDGSYTAYWRMVAPRKSFFNLPSEMQIDGGRIAVDFLGLIMREDRYGARGVVWINSEWEAPEDAEEAEKLPIAKTEAEAQAKGDRKWRAYVLQIAQAHIDQCQQIRASGGVPVAAGGFTRRALREVGWTDPAEAVLLSAQENKKAGSEVEELKETVRRQQESIDKLLAGQTKGPNEPATNARPRRGA